MSNVDLERQQKVEEAGLDKKDGSVYDEKTEAYAAVQEVTHAAERTFEALAEDLAEAIEYSKACFKPSFLDTHL
ncbi:hypothetical protein BT69DRAFT_1330178 [Atractiella rhizophila]|nr:hypothetical protein BT69DRAFT_1330178 [Atractiella rhizophila]